MATSRCTLLRRSDALAADLVVVEGVGRRFEVGGGEVESHVDELAVLVDVREREIGLGRPEQALQAGWIPDQECRRRDYGAGDQRCERQPALPDQEGHSNP